jgi:predicted GNAT superfamily acetyltransferase
VRGAHEVTLDDGGVVGESDALDVARAAAGRAGVEVVEVVDLQALKHVSELLCTIWRRDPGSPQMTTDLLRALSMTGNYVAGAIRDGELAGAAVGFYAEPTRATLHSHISGVSRAKQASGIGYALKLHQRAWAITRGISKITWTFDPLVRRNAYLNITKFRVQPREYLPNFYGEMSDIINQGDASDRLLVEWDLRDASVAAFLTRGFESNETAQEEAPLRHALFADSSGRPVRVNCEDAQLLIGVPEDIEQLRLTDPALAREWRSALRAELGREMEAAARVIGFRKLDGYVVRRSEEASEAGSWV